MGAQPNALIVIAEKARKEKGEPAKASSSLSAEPVMDEESGEADMAYTLGKEFAEAITAKDYPAVYDAVAAIVRRCGMPAAEE